MYIYIYIHSIYICMYILYVNREKERESEREIYTYTHVERERAREREGEMPAGVPSRLPDPSSFCPGRGFASGHLSPCSLSHHVPAPTSAAGRQEAGSVPKENDPERKEPDSGAVCFCACFTGKDVDRYRDGGSRFELLDFEPCEHRLQSPTEPCYLQILDLRI